MWCHGQVNPWQLEERCQVISDTLDHAESQNVEKTNFGKILDCETIPCLSLLYMCYILHKLHVCYISMLLETIQIFRNASSK